LNSSEDSQIPWNFLTTFYSIGLTFPKMRQKSIHPKIISNHLDVFMSGDLFCIIFDQNYPLCYDFQKKAAEKNK
jgi:hypothetical protein